MTGFATSVIACGCEAGIDRELSPDETPDGRPGVRVLLFAVSHQELQKQVENRVGQCVLTCPGIRLLRRHRGRRDAEARQHAALLRRRLADRQEVGGKRYWRVPVMDGEFVCEATTGLDQGAVGGGNLLIMGRTPTTALAAARRRSRRSTRCRT